MPQRRTAIKDLRKNHARRMQNMDIKTDLKKATKEFMSSVTGKNKTEAQSLLKNLYKKFDKAAKRNVLHKNTASRRKSRFSRLLASIA